MSRLLRRLTLACAIALGIGSLAVPASGVALGTAEPSRPAVSPTPYMGWNSYFGLGRPTEDNVHSVAKFLVSSGLAKAGYDIVWLDGGWQASTPRGGGQGDGATPEDIQQKMSEWGGITMREREAVIEGASEKPVEKYIKLIDDYYRSLATKSTER